MLICDLELEHLEYVDGEDLVGGNSGPAEFPSQFLGGSSGVFSVALFGFNGTPFAQTSSFSNLDGEFPAFRVGFGTTVVVQTFPRS
jgi:hypothetical protein